MSSSPAETIAVSARHESPLWGDALRDVPDWQAVFSPLAPAQFALGVETVYEAYLVHYGQSRLFEAQAEDERVLLGDYLYAHGLVRITEAGGVEAVTVMAELISRCAALRATGAEGDADAWLDAVRALGGEPSDDDIARALALHSDRVVA